MLLEKKDKILLMIASWGRWSRLWSYTLPSFPAYYLNMENKR